MNYKTLLHWEARDRESALVVGAEAPRFVEVVMAEGGQVRGCAEVPHAIEIVTSRGAMVRVRDAFSDQTLRRVLDVLERR